MTSELLNFTSARFIRLRLQRIRTLNADLMTLSAGDPRDIDPIVTRRVGRAPRSRRDGRHWRGGKNERRLFSLQYYYSVKDISVGGMCICHGHARSCPLDPLTEVTPAPALLPTRFLLLRRARACAETAVRVRTRHLRSELRPLLPRLPPAAVASGHPLRGTHV